MLGKLICLITRKHKRGRFHGPIREQGGDKIIARMFICPRCEKTWTRKAKA